VKPETSKNRGDYMHIFWGEVFLLALDGDDMTERRFKRWRKLLGDMAFDLSYNARLEARRFLALPACQNSSS